MIVPVQSVIIMLLGGRRINDPSPYCLILNYFIMDCSNYFGGIIAEAKNLYFVKGAAAVSIWIKRYSSYFLPDGLRQSLREYEDSDLSGESLCINIMGNSEMTVRVGSDNYLLVWEVKKCS